MFYLKYALKKLLTTILLLLLASLAIFFLMRANSIDEVTVVGSGTAKKMTEETRIHLIETYHLDDPLIVRYGMWLKSAVTGDFGNDYSTNVPVTQVVASRLPITAGLVLMSILITVVLAIPIGILSALRSGTPLDTGLSVLTLLLTSIPNFLLGILFIVIAAKYFPNYQFVGTYDSFGQYLSRIWVPSLGLAGCMLAGVARITRSSMIEQLKSGYITAVEAKGMGAFNRVFTHAFHNACLPVMTVVSLMVGTMISGTVLMENVFSLPGLGSCLVEAVNTYNYPVVQYITLLLLAAFLLISFLVDMLYMLVDPRGRAGGGADA